MEKKICKTCGETKSIHDFYKNRKYYSGSCKGCAKKRASQAVIDWRRRTKIKLIQFHGGKCMDCRESFPPYVFDFDHRDSADKSFGIATSMNSIQKWEVLLEESFKCDLVCSNCHRKRTHARRCAGCQFCQEGVDFDGGYGLLEVKIPRPPKPPAEPGWRHRLKPHREVIEWPSNEDLVQMIKAANVYQVGKTLGVSDTAIRKRLKTRGLAEEAGLGSRPRAKVE